MELNIRAEEDVGLAKAFGPSRQPAYIRTLLEYGPQRPESLTWNKKQPGAWNLSDV